MAPAGRQPALKNLSEVRRAYDLTKQHPERCSALFP
jgi:hypothetical protein